MKKIIRTISQFRRSVDDIDVQLLSNKKQQFIDNGFEVQTLRISAPKAKPSALSAKATDQINFMGVGSIAIDEWDKIKDDFIATTHCTLNIDATRDHIDERHSNILFELIQKNPSKTFNFTFVFHNKRSSPFFPSASYEQDGYAIGLQHTNLAENCTSLKEWFNNTKRVWAEVMDMCKDDSDFLGIDSSIAPLYNNAGSLVRFMHKLGYSLEQAATSTLFLDMTKFIQTENPKPVGLCGLMLPCLEDFLLANEYEAGNFSIERNLFLSLHCGLGIDTYPFGINEKPERIQDILRIVQRLSDKYKKPLSARFVSDGVASIGQKTDFHNHYLKDVIVRPL